MLLTLLRTTSQKRDGLPAAPNKNILKTKDSQDLIIKNSK